MRSHALQRWLMVGTMLALPVMAYAQEATLSGTVSDTTGGALPGVTVRAVHEASGNSFEAVTDARGDYRLPLRVGLYRVTAELAGFAPVTRTITLLVGQQAVANLQMGVSGVQESVTVTGEAPLLNVTDSSLGGNIDPRQLQELPVQGRNYLDLIMLAPGARANAVGTDTPTNEGSLRAPSTRFGGDFQLNVDGLQVTQNMVTGEGQPRLSRDAIAEFEFLSSRFDATQGRSTGLQVNVVTKSGTNTPSGSFSGYFRHDRFNAADHVAKRVLPYQNQQLSGTFGGPIRKDKLHVFANYEYEHEPQTFVYTTPYAYFNRNLSGVRVENKPGIRLDAQFSPRTRLVVRGGAWWLDQPTDIGGGTRAPSSALFLAISSTQSLVTLTQVLSNRVVNEVKGGYATFETEPKFPPKSVSFFRSSNGPHALLQGVTAGGSAIMPQYDGQFVSSARDDFTYTFTKGGRHTAKLGAEYLHTNTVDLRCQRCEGELTADLGPIPVPVETLFPDLFDPQTWNWAPLSPVSVRWRHQAGSAARAVIPRHQIGAWVQDDWAIVPRLTLNLGLRYDLERNAFNNDIGFGRFLLANRPNDKNNVGPRLGFSFSQSDRTVIRGGYGLYFATVVTSVNATRYKNASQFATPNDGRPDFASNPFSGPKPTPDDLKARECTLALEPGCIRPEAPTAGPVYGPDFVMPYSHQASVGLQRQVGPTMAIEVDYVYIGARGRQDDLPLNVTYNPATGANYPFRDISKRPFPDWGYISLTVNGSRSNYHALQTAFTKRFSRGWQASGTYTLSIMRDARPRPLQWNGTRFAPVPFETAPDLGGAYGLAIGDQRHRATFNGVWQLPYGVQLSGLYFFGSGQHFNTEWGRDLREIGALRPNENRLRPDGSIVPRNSFVGDPIQRVDLRLQRRFPLGGRAGIDGILEVFNLFNHANYESYVTREDNRNYGRPQQARNVTAYSPRTLQLGFRFTF